ncbi:ABC transporter substrate-binding protein [Effusibacillus lacus]|uniref:ABC transporter substrate-binding protein n=1 Tax=Effusibacillus lacus TaxID=1348429 RepID=A0A292YTG5_9BACL|nr:ABC transporter substrate-binding protein [Effusibacillus lacus]TCS75885.1 peptide/nickel transport system substrate-binding protein [Effusibacillus lacus]GAX91724.1 ABC transporter substrate-binding protein [Effusibacillus lacus]
MKKYWVPAALLSVSMILSACSGDKPAAEQKQPKGESQLVIAADQDPVGLDPHKVPAASSLRIYSLVYDSLTTMDAEFNLQSGLADKWETIDNGKTIKFQLHPGVKFHNGREMTSEDVKFTFERILDPKTGSIAKSYFTSIDKIETPDKNTVVFKLKTPDSAFLANTSSSFASIVPKEVADLNKEAVGTGPFKLEKIEQGQYVLLKKNPDYFKQGLPKADSIKFTIMKDEAERLAAIRGGKVDLTTVSADSAKLLENSKGVSVKNYQSMEYSYLGMNVKKKPFDDPRVRQAISYAVDRNAIVQTVWKSQASLTGPIAPAQKTWALDTGVFPSYKRDIEKAKQLLKEAGYADGFKTVIQTASTYPDMIETAQVLQQQLKEIGINAEIQQLEWGTYVNTWKSKDMTLMVGRNTSGTDPDRSMRFFFSTTGSANVWNYSNPDYDKLVQKALETTDVAERKKIYEDAQKMLVQDAPNLFLASPKYFYAVRDNIEGFVPSAAGEALALIQTSKK